MPTSSAVKGQPEMSSKEREQDLHSSVVGIAFIVSFSPSHKRKGALRVNRKHKFRGIMQGSKLAGLI